MRKLFVVLLLPLLLAACSYHGSRDAMGGGTHRTAVVDVFALNSMGDGTGAKLGTVTFMETGAGLIVVPALTGLPPGLHGFHIHQNPDIAPAVKDGKVVPGLSAGGHYDPAGTGKHGGPYDPDGHLGDLPTLFVDDSGTTPYAVLAPKIKSLSAIDGRALIIHVHGDNYSDEPKKLGGGGARFAGGVLRF